ncbi:MAG: T9SS type A sorting domain-containing protein, partial [Bacteroidota bacterium]
NSNFNVFKFTNTGTLVYQDFIPRDTNFSGLTRTPYVFLDGSMLVGGDGSKFPSPNNFQKRLYFMRILSSGYVDTSFHHNTEFDIRNVIRYDESRLLLYGNQLVLYDSVSINKLCLIDTLGNLDTIFRPDFFKLGYPKPLHVQADGKVIVGGAFFIENYSDTVHIMRLNTDGSIDSTFNNFNATEGFWTEIFTVCPTTDGGYLIGGRFSTYQGYPRNNIVKTDGNGFIELDYLDGEGIDSSSNHWNIPAAVGKIVPAQNDKYYVAGHFLKYNGVIVKPIIRILGLSHTVPLEAETAKSQLQVIPNPANKQAVFSWTLPPSVQAFQLRILDQKGRLVREEELASFHTQWTWNTGSVSDGLYFYELRSPEDELMTQGKLIIRK